MSKLLIVEDDPRVGGFLERGLAAEGYAVQWARTGADGLFQGSAPDLDAIILDIMLPGMSGLEVCQELRARGVRTPVLLLTALDATESKIEGLRTGADDYLTKPFDVDELLARIEALIRRSRTYAVAQPKELQVGELTLDLEALVLTSGGRRIELTSKELALLELLMRSPGKVFSRDRILDAVWGTPDDPLTNIVDVYISRLRAKLGDDTGGAQITTVRGRGYKIEAP